MFYVLILSLIAMFEDGPRDGSHPGGVSFQVMQLSRIFRLVIQLPSTYG